MTLLQTLGPESIFGWGTSVLLGYFAPQPLWCEGRDLHQTPDRTCDLLRRDRASLKSFNNLNTLKKLTVSSD